MVHNLGRTFPKNLCDSLVDAIHTLTSGLRQKSVEIRAILIALYTLRSDTIKCRVYFEVLDGLVVSSALLLCLKPGGRWFEPHQGGYEI